MACMLCFILPVAAVASQLGSRRSLLQTWEASESTETPVARVVKLLKGMQETLQQEMVEDEALYSKLKCWCNSNDVEKTEAISTSEAKISALTSNIEALTAKSADLKTTIKELEAQVASDKQALAEAKALREKEKEDYHSAELDSTQAVENLKAAIAILSKHHQAPPDSTVAGGAIFKSERDSWSFLDTAQQVEPHNFLQGEHTNGWSLADASVVKRAIQLVQARHGESYMPAYFSQSGEILGVLKQLLEEMTGDSDDARQLEASRAAGFAELSAAKTSEIDNGEKMAEQKEDELAQTDNALAEAKKDLGQEQAALAENQQFITNLKETCGNADKDFDGRKAARLEEMHAVSETIDILHQDEARDVMSNTYSFVQVTSQVSSRSRERAAKVLWAAAKRVHNPELSILASTVQLDSFEKVKKAIDDMISMLTVQQADEVKKTDWCKAELHANDMTTSRTEDEKGALQAKIAELDNSIHTLEAEIADVNTQISGLYLDLQRASEDRKAANIEFQKTVADQIATVAVLKKALDRLAKYYGFLQARVTDTINQTPPVPQAEYKPSKAAPGVMEMIEKLISEANGLVAESKKSESDAQSAYEQLVSETNDSVKTLQDEVTSKTKFKTEATKDKHQAEADLVSRVEELEGLSKYNHQLHLECDYVLRNFDVRQSSRAEEIESLQQAKQILSGAALA